MSSNTNSLPTNNLKTHLSARIITPIVIGIAAMGAFAITMLMLDSQSLIDKMRIELTLNEVDNLQVRTNNFANLSEEQFWQIINDMDYVSTYAQKIFNNGLNIANFYPVYDAVNYVDYGVPGYKYGGWYNLGSDMYKDHASVIADVFRPLLQSSASYQGVYLGFEDGSFLHHPYVDLGHWPTLQITCVTTGLPVIGYDPRCRGWYDSAKNSPGDVLFSEPYNDATTGDVLITVSKTMYNDTEFIGVIGFDISMSTSGFEDNILEGTVLENGYTYIYDKDGYVIFSPVLEDRDEPYTILDVEFSLDQNADDFESIYNSMKSLNEGSANFTKLSADDGGTESERWFISYRPIDDTQYGIAMVVPYSDIETPANDLAATILTPQIINIVLTVIIVVAASAAIGVNTKRIATVITEPFKTFTRSTQNITQGKIDEEMGRINGQKVMFGASDLNNISNKFEAIIRVTKSANDQLRGNSAMPALKNYLKVRPILEAMNNDRGEGVLDNNMGLAMSMLELSNDSLASLTSEERKAVLSAHDYMSRSTKNAQEQISEAKEEVVSDAEHKEHHERIITFYTSVLGKRYSNISLYYLNRQRYEEALEYINRSIECHRGVDDFLGEMVALNNNGRILMAMNNAAKAEQMFKDSLASIVQKYNTAVTQLKAKYNFTAEQDLDMTVVSEDDNQTFTKIEEALQYAYMNMGLHYFNAKMYNESLANLQSALRIGATIQKNTFNLSVLKMVDIYKTPEYAAAYPHLQAEADKLLAQFNLYNRKPLHIHFVIDVSGSMQNMVPGTNMDRLRAVVQAMIMVITDVIDVVDCVSVTTFHSRVDRLFTERNRGTEYDNIIRDINTIGIGGQTAFFDAVGTVAKDIVDNSLDNSDQWIVALTDGQDNKSRTYCAKDYRGNPKPGYVGQNLLDLVRNHDIGLFVMTVGQLATSVIGEIQKLTQDSRQLDSRRRRHLPIENAAEIGNVFTTIVQIITGGNIEDL